MENQSERLNDSAKKAKRNFMVASILAWALTAEWIKIPGGNLSIGVFRAEASLGVIHWFLAVFLIYSLFEFWLHGPFGDSRRNERKFWMMNPESGPKINAPKLYRMVVNIAGANAFGKIIRGEDSLETWLNQTDTEGVKWERSNKERYHALLQLWEYLPRLTKWRLWKYAVLSSGNNRRLVLEDWTDVLIPAGVGLTGLIAVGIGLCRVVYFC